MKFLVLGCNGMAGHVISIYLTERGHEVIGFAKKKSPFVDTIVGDARNLPMLCNNLKKGKYDAVLNCIGILNQFAENDHESAVFLNSYLPHYLAKITTDMDTQVIHVSTDCVFSGKTGQYPEDAFRDGESFYDRSKALGELDDNSNITIRTSIIGPDINEKGIGLLNWFLQQKNSVNGFCSSIWTGQTTLQLAKTMEKAAADKVHGLYNIVPDNAIDKYSLLCLFNKHIRKNPIAINPQRTFAINKSLIRMRKGFDYQVPDYDAMIQELGDWMRSHRSLYPHYEL